MPDQYCQAIAITVNGDPMKCSAGDTVSKLVSSLGLAPERLAIELNRQIVKPADWIRTEIPEGAVLEIVHFVGGG